MTPDRTTSDRSTPDGLTPDRATPVRTSPNWTLVLGVLALALVLRVVCLERSHLIGADSSRFLRAAESVEQGDFKTAIEDSFHPFTSFAMAGVNRIQSAVLGSPEDFRAGLARRERAGHVVVITAGLLLVWWLMRLAGLLFPGVSPLVVGVLAACQPYFVRSSADIMSDMPYLAFFVFALWQGAVATTVRSVRPVVLAGAGVGLAYLARPEGLVAGLAIGIYWLVRDYGNYRDPRAWRRVVGRGALLVVVTAAVMLPYVAAISSASGRPTLTMKKSASDLLNLPSADRESDGARIRSTPQQGELDGARTAWFPEQLGGSGDFLSAAPVEAAVVGELSARAMFRIFVRWYTAAPEVIAVAFAIGLVGARRREDWRDGRRYLGICAGLAILVLLRLMQIEQNPGYIVRRHVFVLVALALPFAAHGLALLGAWLEERAAWASKWRIGLALVVVVAVVMGVRGVAPRRLDDMAQLDAADWILQQYGHGEVIFTDREKLPYYAGGLWFPIGGDAAAILRSVRSHDRAWVAFYPNRLHAPPEIRELAKLPASGLRLVRSFDQKHREKGTQFELYLWERH